MARTNAGKVQGILVNDYDGYTTLEGYIETANVIVTRVEACAVAKGVTLTAAELELVERWLSAHFYAVQDKPYASNSTNKASASYHGQTGMYLEATLYGQMATRIDWSGCLAAIATGQRAVASADWLGKPPSEQTDYTQRD